MKRRIFLFSLLLVLSACKFSTFDNVFSGSFRLLSSFNSQGQAYKLHVAGSYLWIADGTSGITVYNINNLYFPYLAAQQALSNRYAYDLELVDSRYFYVAEDDGGIWILDTNSSTGTNPVARIDVNNALNLAKNNNIMYVADGDDGLKAYRLTNPTSPEEYGTYNGLLPSTVVYCVAPKDTLAYIGTRAGVEVVNTKNLPYMHGVQDFNLEHTWDITYNNNFVFAASDEGLGVYSIGNDGLLTQKDIYSFSGLQLRAVKASQDMVYVGAYDGLHIMEISPDGNLSEVDFYSAYGLTSFTVYAPYFFLSYGENNIEIIRYNGVE